MVIPVLTVTSIIIIGFISLLMILMIVMTIRQMRVQQTERIIVKELRAKPISGNLQPYLHGIPIDTESDEANSSYEVRSIRATKTINLNRYAEIDNKPDPLYNKQTQQDKLTLLQTKELKSARIS